jgi:hypothetical protein
MVCAPLALMCVSNTSERSVNRDVT